MAAWPESGRNDASGVGTGEKVFVSCIIMATTNLRRAMSSWPPTKSSSPHGSSNPPPPPPPAPIARPATREQSRLALHEGVQVWRGHRPIDIAERPLVLRLARRFH